MDMNSFTCQLLVQCILTALLS